MDFNRSSRPHQSVADIAICCTDVWGTASFVAIALDGLEAHSGYRRLLGSMEKARQVALLLRTLMIVACLTTFRSPVAVDLCLTRLLPLLAWNQMVSYDIVRLSESAATILH